MMTQTKQRTKREIASLIENYGRRNLQAKDSPAYMIDFIDNHHNRLFVGRIGTKGKVFIEYTGTIEQAIGCDELRQACETNKLQYEEKTSRKYFLKGKSVQYIRREGERLVSIADRLETLAK